MPPAHRDTAYALPCCDVTRRGRPSRYRRPTLTTCFWSPHGHRTVRQQPRSRGALATASAAVRPGNALIRGPFATVAPPAFSRRGAARRRLCGLKTLPPVLPRRVGDGFGGCSACFRSASAMALAAVRPGGWRRAGLRHAGIGGAPGVLSARCGSGGAAESLSSRRRAAPSAFSLFGAAGVERPEASSLSSPAAQGRRLRRLFGVLPRRAGDGFGGCLC